MTKHTSSSTLGNPLATGSTIGILGGGQLGRLLSMAAHKLGYRTLVYCPDEGCPAGIVTSDTIIAAYEDETALQDFAARADCITYEFENVPVGTVQTLCNLGGTVYPNARALEVAQDRLSEKKFVQALGIKTAPFMPVADARAIPFALNTTGLPAIMKTRRFGYDGKGQWVIHKESDALQALEQTDDIPSIMEGFVDFAQEISIISVRNNAGQIIHFDCARNEHQDGILRRSIIPCGLSLAITQNACDIAASIVTELDYVGVMCTEFFVTKEQELLVNEIAPRVHNSGHWTQEACSTSQFEAHIRAIAGLPLPTIYRHSACVMENILGTEITNVKKYLTTPHNSVTLYGKETPAPGRKMGHVTTLHAPDTSDQNR